MASNPNAAAKPNTHFDTTIKLLLIGDSGMGEDEMTASLLDLPCVVEAHKMIGNSVLVKSRDIGQV